jgi:hypothetical protein
MRDKKLAFVRRAVMVTIPPLLADIIRQVLVGRVAMEFTAEISDRKRLQSRLVALQPEFVLIGLRRGEDDAIGRTILNTLPRARVIAFSYDARSGYVHEMRPHRTELHDFSVEALFSLVSLPS